MAPIKIFATGATGYIGGDALYIIYEAHPEYEYTCLVRNSDRGAALASQSPKIKLVYGGLDDAKLLEEEAKKADIVLHWADADHEGAAKALTAGIAARSQPGFWIHTSGTGVLMVADLERKVFGEASEKVYNDWDGIGEIWSLPDHAPHHGVEKLVLAAGTEHGDKVRTAIVSPPMIYAPGRGPGNQRSYQLPELVRHTLERGKGFQIGAGKTYWNHVHVRDLSRLFLRLVEEAAKGGGEATWGKDGYYFAESGELVWGHISERVAVEARKQGFIKTDDVDSVDAGEDDKLSPIHFALWGANSRSRAERVRKLLGWVPKEKRPEDEIPEQIQIEAKRLGLVPGHAKKAAGEA